MNELCRFSVFLSLLFSGLGLAATNDGHVPLEDFFKNPETVGYGISPDGKHLSYRKPWKNRLNVYVKAIGSQKETRLTSVVNRDIPSSAWVNNFQILYLQDKGGDENYHIYVTDINTGKSKDLTPFEGVKADIVDDLPDDEEHILISLNKRKKTIFDVYQLALSTGKIKMVAENPGNITSWLADHNGKIRIATTSDGVNTSLLYREKESDKFSVMLTTNFKESLEPLFFTFDNKNLYAISNIGRDKTAAIVFDLKAKKESKVIFEHKEVDVSGLTYSRKRKVLTAAAFTTWKSDRHLFDSYFDKILQDLKTQTKAEDISISSTSKDESKLIAVSYSDKDRGTYYLYDAKTKKLTNLGSISPWLDQKKMASMQPISFQARDGLTINGYLTIPNGSNSKNLPVVVNPHGGPWARDSWGFNPEVQFLANRGFAVLQLNFRSSTGYGRAFLEKGFKQWGRAMQDDITDGVKWLIKQGVADQDRVCIYGGSYGGYATLAGITFTPDLYACGIDYVGVSNIFTFMDTIPPYWEPYRKMLYEMVGDPVKDKEMLTAASPYFHVDKIKAPLLIAQGANDPRVKQQESDQIVEKLRSRKIDVKYILKKNEGHGFRNQENRFEFYRAMEDFLNKHIGQAKNKTH